MKFIVLVLLYHVPDMKSNAHQPIDGIWDLPTYVLGLIFIIALCLVIAIFVAFTRAYTRTIPSQSHYEQHDIEISLHLKDCVRI